MTGGKEGGNTVESREDFHGQGCKFPMFGNALLRSAIACVSLYGFSLPSETLTSIASCIWWSDKKLLSDVSDKDWLALMIFQIPKEYTFENYA